MRPGCAKHRKPCRFPRGCARLSVIDFLTGGEAHCAASSSEAAFFAPVLGVILGRDASQLSISERRQAIVFSPKATGFGKSYLSIARASAIRSFTIPFSFRYRNLTKAGFCVVGKADIMFTAGALFGPAPSQTQKGRCVEEHRPRQYLLPLSFPFSAQTAIPSGAAC